METAPQGDGRGVWLRGGHGAGIESRRRTVRIRKAAHSGLDSVPGVVRLWCHHSSPTVELSSTCEKLLDYRGWSARPPSQGLAVRDAALGGTTVRRCARQCGYSPGQCRRIGGGGSISAFVPRAAHGDLGPRPDDSAGRRVGDRRADCDAACERVAPHRSHLAGRWQSGGHSPFPRNAPGDRPATVARCRRHSCGTKSHRQAAESAEP